MESGDGSRVAPATLALVLAPLLLLPRGAVVCWLTADRNLSLQSLEFEPNFFLTT
jgi:hypothetical protein